jgi:hypothetical protein
MPIAGQATHARTTAAQERGFIGNPLEMQKGSPADAESARARRRVWAIALFDDDQ